METIEPIAKFQGRINKDGRVTIPKQILNSFGIKQNDYVKVIVRKIEIVEKTITVLAQALLVVKIGKYGAITIPRKLIREMGLNESTQLEIILLDFYKFDELVSEKGKKLLLSLQSQANYRILPLDATYTQEIGVRYRYLV
ncbi:AbrB/MazE/SpoVT family DNA-binding domain-containing protein [Pyrococcus kukulkanii]|uniref:AbrB/MazE/SpoVT family DNA-binding domain-containing protein n=1 Tax=Pyrococcus kukulkanii TaxID=1609559 RepID=UPI003568C229